MKTTFEIEFWFLQSFLVTYSRPSRENIQFVDVENEDNSIISKSQTKVRHYEVYLCTYNESAHFYIVPPKMSVFFTNINNKEREESMKGGGELLHISLKVCSELYSVEMYVVCVWVWIIG